MSKSFEGQTALVTGSGKGIGRSIACTLASQRMNVICTSRTEKEIKETVELIRDAGGKAEAVRSDIADEKSVIDLFQGIDETYGALDLLVNNAGIGKYSNVAETEVSDIEDIMSVNIKGTFICCREAMKMMIPKKSGYIINISSVVGIKGYPGQAAYTASKHGIMGLTKSLAVEAQEHGIRVSAILPGGVDTEMVRSARPDLDPSVLLQPEDVAETVLYLVSLPERAAVDQIYIRRSKSSPF